MSDLLKQLDYIVVVGESESSFETVNLIENVEHDVVMLDVATPCMGGIETIESVLIRNSEERIIYRTAFEYPDILRAALASGARGFITEDTPIREIDAVIK